MKTPIDSLSENRTQSVVGPAGCGKTYSIAEAVKLSEGRQLILTHTHAGIRSLRSKLKTLQVPPSKFTLDTIHGFFMRFAASYPTNSGLDPTMPKQELWGEIISAFINLMDTNLIKQVLQNSYSGVFVDEYQDCTLNQHDAILKIAEIVPVRVLGDPLQGIFGFDQNNQIVEWKTNVSPYFPSAGILSTPWRWKDKNEKLGTWLYNLREDLWLGKEIDIQKTDGLVNWYKSPSNHMSKVYVGTNIINNIPATNSFAAIHQFANRAHTWAENQRGRIQSMEEMECKELFSTLQAFETSSGKDLLLCVIDFIKKCVVMNEFLVDVTKQRKNKTFNFSKISNPVIKGWVEDIYHNHSYISIANLIEYTLQIKRSSIYRRELLTEMLKSLREYVEGDYEKVEDAAWVVRSRTRIRGQILPRLIVSRPLLIKGLEFDQALVVDAKSIKDARNFYVCVTRASHKLYIISESPILKFDI